MQRFRSAVKWCTYGREAIADTISEATHKTKEGRTMQRPRGQLTPSAKLRSIELGLQRARLKKLRLNEYCLEETLACPTDGVAEQTLLPVLTLLLRRYLHKGSLIGFSAFHFFVTFFVGFCLYACIFHAHPVDSFIINLQVAPDN